MAEKPLITPDEIRKFIQYHHWQEAKSYAAFCPHEYHMGFWIKRDWDKDRFMRFITFIKRRGFLSKYGNIRENAYLIVDDYYYWTCGEVPNEGEAFNRAKLDDYIFWREYQLDGSILRCRYRHRNEPVQPREALWREIGPSVDGRQGEDLRLL